jgi:mono/diheme cytochrome c family protein
MDPLLRRVFAATSVVLLAVLAISPAKNAFRPYRSLQARFRNLGTARARSAKAAEDYRRRPVAIRQIWLRELDDRVDRCTTCHLGVADATMADVPQPFRLHPRTAHTPDGFGRFGCTACHGGEGLATLEAEAHGVARDAGPPLLPPAYMESGCGRCHAGESVPDAPVLSRGRSLMARSGCYACHLVRGQEGYRSEAPPLATEASKTGGEWVRRWLRDPKAMDPNATMPKFSLSDDDAEAIVHYVFSVGVPEDLRSRIAAAGAEPLGDAKNGKKLFSEARCISCHTVEGKGNGSAPELSRVATAASRGWLLAFLRDPQAFHSTTRMPRYHFSEAESRDVVAYMEDEFRDFDAPKDILDPVRVRETLAERGEKLFRQYGCFACHSPGGPGGERFGPDLNGIGDKKVASLDFGRRGDLPRTLPAWLDAKIADPRSFAAGLRMPAFGFTPEDSRAVVTSLLSLGAAPVPASYRHEPVGPSAALPAGPVGALIQRYRCLSCHQIGDRGGDISTAPLTFEGSKVKRDWLVDYLVLSYTIRPILEDRMPVFRMSREEAVQLADALEAFFVDARIPDDPFAGRPPAQADPTEGQRLYVTLGCRACHIIGSSGGYYGPPLTEAGARLKPGWTYAWLKAPQRWRADVRCPDFGLTDTDALRLAAYLDSLRPAGKVSTGAAR